MFEITSEKVSPQVAIVKIAGRVDVQTSMQLEDAANDRIAEGETTLILDFSRVLYINSWGMRCILAIDKSLIEKDGSLIICGLNSTVREVFQISGFDSILRTFTNVEAALKAI